MLYEIINNTVNPEPLTAQEKVLAEHLFGGYQIVNIDDSVASSVEDVATMLATTSKEHINDVLLVNISNEEKKCLFVDGCAKHGVRAVFDEKPSKLLNSSAFDLMLEVVRISKETPSDNIERLHAQEELMDVIDSTAMGYEYDAYGYGIKLVVDEMVRRAMYKLMA